MSRDPEVVAAGVEALSSGWLTMGPRTEALEAALSERFGSEHAIATSSGTAALHLSCLALGVGRGDEVLVPAVGPRSCSGAPLATGARVRAYPGGLGPIDPDEILSGVQSGTRAVVARHPLGFTVEMGPLREACERHGTALIEDCRDAAGAANVPGESAVAILSFGSGRQIDANEGGAVLTDREDVAAAVRSLRSHAMTSGTWDRHRGHAETYDVVDVGFNYRIDEIRAALAQAGLRGLDREVAIRRERAEQVLAAARPSGGELPAGLDLAGSSPLAVPLELVEGADRSALAAALPEGSGEPQDPWPLSEPAGSGDARAGRVLAVPLAG